MTKEKKCISFFMQGSYRKDGQKFHMKKVWIISIA